MGFLKQFRPELEEYIRTKGASGTGTLDPVSKPPRGTKKGATA
jgi:hypothetical protein